MRFFIFLLAAAFAALSCVPAPCSARALPEKIERAAVAGVLPFPSVLCLYLGSAEKIIAIPPASMSAARRLTQTMLDIFPDDPLKGDFALFGYGVNTAGQT